MSCYVIKIIPLYCFCDGLEPHITAFFSLESINYLRFLWSQPVFVKERQNMTENFKKCKWHRESHKVSLVLDHFGINDSSSFLHFGSTIVSTSTTNYGSTPTKFFIVDW